jgi:outer membrane lipoprotein-sorting protein
MLRKMILAHILLSLAIPIAISANVPEAPAQLSAAQIVERNVAARGGLQAWRAVQTMSYSGKMDAGGKQNVQLPFVMEMKRPRKTRVEIEFAKDKAVQVYDGANGWKLRPFLGRREVEPFTIDEVKAASMESDLDGPLVDYATKGTQVDVEGVEKVEGQDAYKLKLNMKGGQVRQLWVDTQTFLEVKIEGVPRRMDGKMHPVEIYYRDYKSVNGLVVPYVLETTVQGVKQSHKMTIESVVVNPKLDDSLFTKPSPQPRTQVQSK